MKITTKAVYDMATGELLLEESYQYSGVVALCHSSPTTAENTGYAQNSADKAKQNTLIDENEATASQYNGPAEKTPYYRSRLNTDITATSKAFNDTRAQGRLAGNARGFGYTSPIAQGNEQSLASEESSRLGQLPGEALDATAKEQDVQSGIRSGEASSLGSDAGTELSTAANAENQRLARRSAMWNSIISGGAAVAGAAI